MLPVNGVKSVDNNDDLTATAVEGEVKIRRMRLSSETVFRHVDYSRPHPR